MNGKTTETQIQVDWLRSKETEIMEEAHEVETECQKRMDETSERENESKGTLKALENVIENAKREASKAKDDREEALNKLESLQTQVLFKKFWKADFAWQVIEMERKCVETTSEFEKAQEALDNIQKTTEQTIEKGRRDIHEVESHVEALTQELRDLSIQRDVLHKQIQTEKAEHEKSRKVACLNRIGWTVS